jgi:hypothetical protein
MGEAPIPERHCSVPFSRSSCPGLTRAFMLSCASVSTKGQAEGDDQKSQKLALINGLPFLAETSD